MRKISNGENITERVSKEIKTFRKITPTNRVINYVMHHNAKQHTGPNVHLCNF